MSTTTAPLTLATATLAEHAAAVASSLHNLGAAARSAMELLTAAGFAGMAGDTADDLRKALAIHGHLVHQFTVKVSTAAGTSTFNTHAMNACSAAEAAAARQGETACGITVTPADPDLRALSAAHRDLRISGPLDDALKDPSLRVALRSWARKRQRYATPQTDFKSLAANDRD